MLLSISYRLEALLILPCCSRQRTSPQELADCMRRSIHRPKDLQGHTEWMLTLLVVLSVVVLLVGLIVGVLVVCRG